ncbi:MAG: Fumarate reductase/succinate dehydrogenase flavoprotein-like protein, partial [Ramlibacter sp.]|nr:Fumarate reductase/succinate dehydrogenase flavoprotein-like protein [Ramlibacter sp.]
TGGFQGNAELLGRYVSPHAQHMYLRANPWSTGDGLLAALDAGAATTPALDTFYGHAMTAPPARFGADRFQEMSHKYGPMAVAINLDGRRFADESAGTGEETLNIAVARQQNATAAYVFDAATADRPYEAGPLARVIVERARQAGGHVVQARPAAPTPPRRALRRGASPVYRGAGACGDHVHLRRAQRGPGHASSAPRCIRLDAANGEGAG